MKKAIDKVPNIVFLIIAIAAIAVAGLMFALYSLEKERAVNSLNEIARLEKDVNKLMNRNSDLMMQMGGIEEQKEKLEEKAKKSDDCWITEENKFSLSEIATIKGYYKKEEGDKEKCGFFVVTETSDDMMSSFEEEELLFGISLGETKESIISENEKDMIKNSAEDEQIELFVQKDRFLEAEPNTCSYNLNILGIDR